MQNFNHSGQDKKQANNSNENRQTTQNNSWVTKVLTNLDVVGSILMLISLFLGSFYKTSGEGFLGEVIPGYKLIFNSDYLLGSLLVIIPIILLVVKYIDSLKKYKNLADLVGFVVTIMFVFVVKGQAGSIEDGDFHFAIGAIVYLLGNIIGLIGAATAFFGFDLNGEVNKRINK